MKQPTKHYNWRKTRKARARRELVVAEEPVRPHSYGAGKYGAFSSKGSAVGPRLYWGKPSKRKITLPEV